MFDQYFQDRIEEEFAISEEQDEMQSILKRPILEFLKVREDLSVVKVEASLQEVLDLMRTNNDSSVLVIDSKNRLVGIVTERDFMRKVLGKDIDLKETSVAHTMTPDPMSLFPSDLLVHAVSNMILGGFRHIPIVNQTNEPIGMLSIRDVASIILEEFKEEYQNSPLEPFRGQKERDAA